MEFNPSGGPSWSADDVPLPPELSAAMASELAAAHQSLVPTVTVYDLNELSSLNLCNTSRYACFSSSDRKVDRPCDETECCLQKKPRLHSPPPPQQQSPGAGGSSLVSCGAGGSYRVADDVLHCAVNAIGTGEMFRDLLQSQLSWELEEKSQGRLSREDEHPEEAGGELKATSARGISVTLPSERSTVLHQLRTGAPVLMPRCALSEEDVALRQYECYRLLTGDAKTAARTVVPTAGLGLPGEGAQPLTPLTLPQPALPASTSLHLLDLMRRVGVPPSLACYRRVMTDLAYNGRHLEVVDLLDSMTLDGVAPDLYTYQLAVRLLLDGQQPDISLRVALDASKALSHHLYSSPSGAAVGGKRTRAEATATDTAAGAPNTGLGPQLWRALFLSLLRGKRFATASGVSATTIQAPVPPTILGSKGEGTDLDIERADAIGALLEAARHCVYEGGVGILTVEEQLELCLQLTHGGWRYLSRALHVFFVGLSRSPDAHGATDDSKGELASVLTKIRSSSVGHTVDRYRKALSHQSSSTSQSTGPCEGGGRSSPTGCPRRHGGETTNPGGINSITGTGSSLSSPSGSSGSLFLPAADSTSACIGAPTATAAVVRVGSVPSTSFALPSPVKTASSSSLALTGGGGGAPAPLVSVGQPQPSANKAASLLAAVCSGLVRLLCSSSTGSSAAKPVKAADAAAAAAAGTPMGFLSAEDILLVCAQLRSLAGELCVPLSSDAFCDVLTFCEKEVQCAVRRNGEGGGDKCIVDDDDEIVVAVDEKKKQVSAGSSISSSPVAVASLVTHGFQWLPAMRAAVVSPTPQLVAVAARLATASPGTAASVLRRGRVATAGGELLVPLSPPAPIPASPASTSSSSDGSLFGLSMYFFDFYKAFPRSLKACASNALGSCAGGGGAVGLAVHTTTVEACAVMYRSLFHLCRATGDLLTCLNIVKEATVVVPRGVSFVALHGTLHWASVVLQGTLVVFELCAQDDIQPRVRQYFSTAASSSIGSGSLGSQDGTQRPSGPAGTAPSEEQYVKEALSVAAQVQKDCLRVLLASDDVALKVEKNGFLWRSTQPTASSGQQQLFDRSGSATGGSLGDSLKELTSTEGKPADFYISVGDPTLLSALAVPSLADHPQQTQDTKASQAVLTMMRRYDTGAGAALLITMDALAALHNHQIGAGSAKKLGKKERKACVEFVGTWLRRHRWFHVLPLTFTVEAALRGGASALGCAHPHPSEGSNTSSSSLSLGPGWASAIAATQFKRHHKKVVTLVGDQAVSATLTAPPIALKPVLTIAELMARLGGGSG